MMNDDTHEVRQERFDSLNNIYQNNLEPMKDSQFAFDYVHLLYYKCHIKSKSWWIIYRFS